MEGGRIGFRLKLRRALIQEETWHSRVLRERKKEKGGYIRFINFVNVQNIARTSGLNIQVKMNQRLEWWRKESRFVADQLAWAPRRSSVFAVFATIFVR